MTVVYDGLLESQRISLIAGRASLYAINLVFRSGLTR